MLTTSGCFFFVFSQTLASGDAFWKSTFQLPDLPGVRVSVSVSEQKQVIEAKVDL